MTSAEPWEPIKLLAGHDQELLRVMARSSRPHSISKWQSFVDWHRYTGVAAMHGE